VIVARKEVGTDRSKGGARRGKSPRRYKRTADGSRGRWKWRKEPTGGPRRKIEPVDREW